jgi:predicted lipoprotein with Yx(FWY)xxD motif
MITEATTPSQPRPPLGRKAARPLSALAGVAVVGLIAAACGSSTPTAKSNTTTTAASPAGATGSGSAGATVADAKSNATIGSSILVNSSGMTLYKFSADTAGMSACSGTCATAWPPLTVASGTTPKGGSGASGTFGTITRSDGTLQVTHNGDPLYTFSGDTSAGATNGQNLTVNGGTWTVVTVGSSSTKATTPVTKTPATTKPASGGGYGY